MPPPGPRPSFLICIVTWDENKDARPMTSTELKSYTVRPLLWEELPLTKPLRIENGVLMGTHQLETYWKVDPGSIYGAITEDGELYGACAVPFVGTDIAYLCLMGVAAPYRRRGIATKLMETAMQHVGTHNIYTHCIPEQVHFFRDRWNFQIYIRELKSLGPGVPKTSKLTQAVSGVQVQELTPQILPLVVKYDEFVFGTCRKKFVETSTGERDARTVVACRGLSRVCGYAILTTTMTGHAVVRGIYADAEDIAELLLVNLLRDSPYSSTITIIVQMRNSEELYFEQKIGLQRTNDFKTLFRWPMKNGDLTKVYATAL
ncbi:uncharacterized protein LOC121047422 [Ixodes scapularis]|uniref:uncharacterized protein LOC121047422 n=1 Tax=Ixodes scapularis TaxID=6945 RepID=UPI001C38A4E4|nr:uncharacterized protein LOC121047422 [Ixodes scapularis]